MAWPTSKHCQRCKQPLSDYRCLKCGGPNPTPEKLEVIDVREQDGKLYIDLHHVYIGSEYNYDDTIMLSAEDAVRIREQLGYVLRERRLPPASGAGEAQP